MSDIQTGKLKEGRSALSEIAKAVKPGAEWHKKFHSALSPNVKVWLTLCNPTGISTLVCAYVKPDVSLAQSRKKFTGDLRRHLKAAIADLEKAQDQFLDRFGRTDPDIDQALLIVRRKLESLQPLLNERRLGVNNPLWILAYLEAYIEQCCGRTPPPRILEKLVRAGRAASGQAVTSWDSAEVMGKNLKNFKKRKDNETMLNLLAKFDFPGIPRFSGPQNPKSTETNSAF